MIYLFNQFQIDTNNFVLKNDEKIIETEPQVFNLIVYLIENKSFLVSRDELIKNVWQGRVVLDATLSNHIKKARQILGDDGVSQNVIKTIHGRGYQFIADIDKTPNTSNPQVKFGFNPKQKLFSYLGLIAVLLILGAFLPDYLKSQNNNFNINPQQKSIAVLAFLDMSPDKDHEYFSDGISEEILNKLAHIPELRVISRTSSFYFKDKDATIKDIGEQLKVSHVLEGSVRKQNNKIRITVQLIDVSNSQHLWSETYDDTLDDVLKIQDSIANSVSEKLQLSLLPHSNSKTKVNPDAYNVYLQAKHIGQTRSKDNFKKAELTIKKSIAFDPDFAQSWQYLSHIVFESTFSFGMRSYNDGIEISTYTANKALAIDPNYAPSYAALARIQSQQRDFVASDKNMKKALSLDSKNAKIIDTAALNAMFAGDLIQSLNYRRQLMDIDPKYSRNHYSIGQLKYLLLDFDAAYQSFNKYISLKPDSAVTHHMISSVLLAQGKNKLALSHAQQEKNTFWKHYAMCMAVFANGDMQLADKLLNDFIDDYGQSDLANTARIYAFRSEIDKSFEWLNKAFEHPDSTLLNWLNYPEFRKMHGDSRWHELITKMELPSSHWLIQKDEIDELSGTFSKYQWSFLKPIFAIN